MGDVNGDAVGKEASKAVVVAYDALTLAGTQGYFNHLKLDRMLELAEVQHPASASASASAPAPASASASAFTYPTITHLPIHPRIHPPTPVS